MTQDKTPERVWVNTRPHPNNASWHDATTDFEQTKRENEEYFEGFLEYVRGDIASKAIVPVFDWVDSWGGNQFSCKFLGVEYRVHSIPRDKSNSKSWRVPAGQVGINSIWLMVFETREQAQTAVETALKNEMEGKAND